MNYQAVVSKMCIFERFLAHFAWLLYKRLTSNQSPAIVWDIQSG
jgi:hypothetical protein